MMKDQFARQVRLLAKVLPYVAREENFSLKGGSAINYFHRDFPRLSVDIDLTWLPLGERAESLSAIDATLSRIGSSIQAGITGTKVYFDPARRPATRLRVFQGETDIKIETSPVQRGIVHQVQFRMATDRAKALFGNTKVQVVSFEEMYAG